VVGLGSLFSVMGRAFLALVNRYTRKTQPTYVPGILDRQRNTQGATFVNGRYNPIFLRPLVSRRRTYIQTRLDPGPLRLVL
jgi:hypothetical protein